MIPRPLRIAALLLAAAAPAAAQELRLDLQRVDRDASFSIGYGSRSGLHAGLRLGTPQRSVCAPAPRRVWVPGAWERAWVEPLYDLRRGSCGTTVRVLVRAGYWREVWRPGHWTSVARDAGYGHRRAGSYGRGSIRRAR